MKRRGILLIGLLLLVIVIMLWQGNPSYPGSLLDRSYTTGGLNDMSNWSVGFQWMGDPEIFRDDITSGSYDINVNAPGGFSLTMPLDDFALNLIGDTVVRIYYDGVPQFWGYFDGVHNINEVGQSVSINGGDMIARMSLRNVDFQACTSYGVSDPPRGDDDSKSVFENLLHWYTGADENDSMFRNEFIEYSETAYRYIYDGNSLTDALIDVALSSSLTVDGQKNIGYAFWVEAVGDVLLQPYGWRKYSKDLAGGWNLSFDYGGVKNRVHFRGGIPEAWELVEGGIDTYSYDAFETSAQASNWPITGGKCDESGSNPTVSSDFKAVGASSFRLSNHDFLVLPASYGTMTYTFSSNQDWSYTDEYGVQQSTVQAYRLWYAAKDGTDGDLTNQEAVLLDLRLVDGSAGVASDAPSTNLNPDDGKLEWAKIVQHFDDWDDQVMDWSDIDKIELKVAGIIAAGSTNHHIYLDGLAFFFKEVDVWRRDEASILVHGIKEIKFQDRRITDWATGEKITDNLIEMLSTPAVMASQTVPYFDPDLKLNMLIEPEVAGVTWPLYVNGLTINWTGDHVTTAIKAGTPVVNDEYILHALHILRDQDSEKGTGFQMADTYEHTSCMKDKERYCRTDCQVSNCQTGTELLSCYTFQERNPCITSCQRYKERTGWLNRIIE